MYMYYVQGCHLISDNQRYRLWL